MSTVSVVFTHMGFMVVAGDCIGLYLNLDDGFIAFTVNAVPVCFLVKRNLCSAKLRGGGKGKDTLGLKPCPSS